jgi:enoyl-CoA hydratase
VILTNSLEHIRLEVRNGLGVISLARPERLNALTHETMSQLQSALRTVGDQPNIRVVILRGEGRAFCAGLDLEAGVGLKDNSNRVESVRAEMRVGMEVVWALRTIPQPVISVVQGHAVGAGFALAAASDCRFIGRDASFSAPFLPIGVSVGDLGLSWFLPRLLGHGRAAELFLSAQAIDATRAVALGLASHVSEDPLVDALDFAERLASFPPYGIAASKELLNASWSSSLRDHLEAEARAQTIGLLTESAQSAMKAILGQQTGVSG